MTLVDKKKLLRKNNQVADRCLKARAKALEFIDLPPAAPYSSAKRVKDDELLIHNQEEDNWPGGRTDYEIDRDQILFSPAFVRLARKTQVFIGQKDVIFKTRLTHTLEVAQLAHSRAHKEGLNVDLVEAIAYGHDVGHPPFAHTGEHVLNMCLYEYFIHLILGLDPPSLLRPTGEILDLRQTFHDHVLWLLIENLIELNATERRKQGRVDKSFSKSLLSDLLGRNILAIQDGLYLFNKPLEWDAAEELKDTLRNEFWIQPSQGKLFSHEVHSLRVLLYNPRRSWADLTHQTAYGILYHAWQEYENFGFNLPDDKNIVLSKGKDLSTGDSSVEAFLIRIADKICFVNSDIDDALAAGLLEWEEDLTSHEKTILCELGGSSDYTSGFPSRSKRLQYCESKFDFSNRPPKYKLLKPLKDAYAIITKKLYPMLFPREESAKRIIRDLFWFFCVCRDTSDSKIKDNANRHREVEIAAWRSFAKYNERWGSISQSPARLAVDYIAQLTDDEAISAHAALFSPEEAPWVRYFLEAK